MKEILFSTDTLIPIGMAFSFLGGILWTLNLTNKAAYAIRDAHARQLESEEKLEMAKKIEKGTAMWKIRPKVYGKCLVALGFLSIIGGVFSPW